jgi:hypothetical protein
VDTLVLGGRGLDGIEKFVRTLSWLAPLEIDDAHGVH